MMWNYKFEAVTTIDYLLKLSAVVDNKLYSTILNKLKPKINEDNVDLENIKIIVPKNYYALFKTYLLKDMKNFINMFKQDKIEIMDYHIKKVSFYKYKEDWKVDIEIEGNFADKR